MNALAAHHSRPPCPAGFAKFGIHRIEVLDTQGVLGPGPGVPAGAWRRDAQLRAGAAQGRPACASALRLAAFWHCCVLGTLRCSPCAMLPRRLPLPSARARRPLPGCAPPVHSHKFIQLVCRRDPVCVEPGCLVGAGRHAARGGHHGGAHPGTPAPACSAVVCWLLRLQAVRPGCAALPQRFRMA